MDFQSQTAFYVCFTTAYLKVKFVSNTECNLDIICLSNILWEMFKINCSLMIFSQFV